MKVSIPALSKAIIQAENSPKAPLATNYHIRRARTRCKLVKAKVHLKANKTAIKQVLKIAVSNQNVKR